MKSAALPNGSGPGSSIALSPTSIRVRDAIIEKFIDKSLDELNNFLTSALDTERDESKRIGILAARVYILRTRISKIMEFNQNSMIPAIEAVSLHELVNNPQISDKAVMDDEDLAESAVHLEEWNELMTIEAGEVNGVRIPSGVAITVGRDDAVRLIETGKAKLITEEEPSQRREPEQEVTPNAPDIQEMDTEIETESAEQMPVEQNGEMSIDDVELTVEDSEMPAADTTNSDSETNLQETSQAEDNPTQDDHDAKAETDVELTVEDSEMPAADTTNSDSETNLQETSQAEDNPTQDDRNSETNDTRTQS